MAKKFFPNDIIRHQYYLDLIIEGLQDRDLRIAPTRLGYFEGCQRTFRAFAPEVDWDFSNYRRLLTKVEGLEIIELSNQICCVEDPTIILHEGKRLGLESILCLCPGCFLKIKGVSEVSNGKAVYFPQLLLDIIKVSNI
jgi:hypothetical protein